MVIGDQRVTHRVFPPAEAYVRFFQPRFELRESYAMGFLRRFSPGPEPPTALAMALARLEAALGAYRPFLAWGRFYVLDLEKR